MLHVQRTCEILVAKTPRCCHGRRHQHGRRSIVSVAPLVASRAATRLSSLRYVLRSNILCDVAAARSENVADDKLKQNETSYLILILISARFLDLASSWLPAAARMEAADARSGVGQRFSTPHTSTCKGRLLAD